MVNIGTHVSSSKSLDLVFDRALEVGAKSIQFFLRSPRSWAWIERSEKEKSEFLYKKSKYNIEPLIVHASYLFNLASFDENLRKKSIEGVIQELNLCEELAIDYYVIHAGKTKGKPIEEGINNIVKALEEIFSKIKLDRTTFLIETLAGQGGEVGSKLEDIYKIVKNFKNENIGVCVDTCHIFAAGYNISNKEGFNDFKIQLDSLLGLEMVKVIHCNDSKAPFSSKKDRHEHIGKGFIGLKGFELFLNDEYFSKLPFILETPKEGDMDRENISVLKSLVRL